MADKQFTIPANNLKEREEDLEKSVKNGILGPIRKIYGDPKLQKFYVKSPKDFEKRGYKIGDFRLYNTRRFSDYDKPRLVYELVPTGETKEEIRYYFKTGLYVGFLFIGTGADRIRLDITSGYNETFFQRMLNVANNFFLDTSSSSNSNKSDASLSNMMNFMFLTSFKAAYAMGMPSEYRTIHEHGFNIKGKLDIKKYIQKDMFTGGAFSYSYRQREYVQDIIDVLYLAMRTVLDSYKATKISAEYNKYYRELAQMRSGKTVSRGTIHKIRNHRSLNNPLYNRYKSALYFAEMILKMKEVIRDENESYGYYSGFLLDISQLWEVYLENLLRHHLGDEYIILAQEEIKLYEDTFYHRTNRPDLVIETKDHVPVAVIDAKFKKMEYNNDDVDREDMFQINHYAGYYNEISRQENGKPLRFCALVYPAKSDPAEERNTDTSLYGIEPTKFITKFSVEHIRIPEDGMSDSETMKKIIDGENAFIDRIKKLLENVPPEN